MPGGKEPYPGATKNMRPIKKGQTDIPRLGGLAKSPAKARASRINGLYSKKKLTEYDRKILEFFDNKDPRGLVDALIQKLLIDYADDPKIINDAINQIQKQIPNLHINMNVSNEDVTLDSVFEVLHENKQEKLIPLIQERIKTKLGMQ